MAVKYCVVGLNYIHFMLALILKITKILNLNLKKQIP